MSSLRNSLHRRNHKERSQLANRTRFGILEKHKDYVLRARDFHAKQQRLHRLREKASERNRDEFYFGMVHERTKNGVHVQDRGNKALPVDIVKILKTQDENYIRMRRQKESKKIDQLRATLGNLADSSVEEEKLDRDEIALLQSVGYYTGKRKKSRHVIFVEDEHVNLAKTLGQDIDNDNSAQRPPSVDLGWTDSVPVLENDVKDAIMPEVSQNDRLQTLKELASRLKRQKLLRYAERELEMQRLLMSRGAHKKVLAVEKIEEGDNDDSDDDDDHRRGSKTKHQPSADENSYRPRIYKWRAERKK